MNNTRIYYLKEMDRKLVYGSKHEQLQQERQLMSYLWEYAKKQQEIILYYSKSHSGGKALLAVSPSPVGCDLENIRWDWSTEELEKRMKFYLTEQEAQLVLGSRTPCVTALLAWTRKESYFKVHQQRNVPPEFILTADSERVQGAEMEFVSKMLGERMIATCYHRKEQEVEWIVV